MSDARERAYWIRVQMLGADGHGGAYESATTALLRGLEAAFAGRELVINRAGDIAGRPQAWVSHVQATTRLKETAFGVVDWAVRSADRGVVRLTCAIGTYALPSSITHARWVPLVAGPPHAEATSDRGYVGSMNEWPVACPTCRARDTEHPPQPYQLSPATARANRQDLFIANHGLLAVRGSGVDVLLRCAGGDLEEVAVAAPSDLRLFRATRFIGPLAEQRSEGPCPACGVPNRIHNPDRTVTGQIVTDFGDLAWNIARVGARPVTAHDDADPHKRRNHPLVVSGGLYAALYNAGLKDLAWPDDGAYVSVKPDEPTWEEHRRFADLFAGKADRILRKKVKAPDVPGAA